MIAPSPQQIVNISENPRGADCCSGCLEGQGGRKHTKSPALSEVIHRALTPDMADYRRLAESITLTLSLV